MSEGATEWGVARDNEPDVMHRGPMAEEAARAWVQEWENEVAPKARKGMFIVIHRHVSPWLADADE